MLTRHFTKVSIHNLATGRCRFPEGWSQNADRLVVHGREWPLVSIKLHRGGKAIYVTGDDGRKYQHLLMMSDDTKIVGTRGEIQTRFNIRTFYPSQQRASKPRTETQIQARKKIFALLGIDADPTRMDIEYVPPSRRYRQHWHTFLEEWDGQDHDGKVMVVQPPGMRRKKYINLLNQLRKLNGHKPFSYPVLGKKRRWRHRFQRV